MNLTSFKDLLFRATHMFYFPRLSILQVLPGDAYLFTWFVFWEILHVKSPLSL